MRDYYPDWGIHQGYMPAFAEAAGVDLDAVFGYYAKAAGVEKLAGLSGNDKLSRTTDAIEALRQYFSLDDLIHGAVAPLKPEAETEINNQLDVIFNADGPAQLDVFFELLEWNISGPQNQRLFITMMDRLLPDELWQTLDLGERGIWLDEAFDRLCNAAEFE